MKRTLCILIIILLLFTSSTALASNGNADPFPLKKGDSSDIVVEIQMRLKELGYISFRATGRYGDMTSDGVREFQHLNGLSADGYCGRDTYDKMFSDEAIRNKANANIPRIFGPLKTAAVETGILADWHETVDALFPKGKSAEVTDFNTGKTFTVRRTGGVNHADVQTVSPESFYTYKTIFGGGGTWERRSVIVKLGDTKYAASLIGVPTGSLNGSTMAGSVDLYFWGSYSDFALLKDVEHSKACLTANGN